MFTVSVLYREPKLLKSDYFEARLLVIEVSVLYREPKLLKSAARRVVDPLDRRFSALP